MQRLVRLLVALCIALPIWCGSAAAQQSPSPIPNFNGDIQQSDFPCAIVLCVISPSTSKCQPPIKWLVTNFIEKGRSWPTCNFGDGGATTATYSSQPNLACPSNFTAEQASSENGSMGLTGVCLRAVPTCAVTGRNAYTPSVPGAACYTVTIDNNNEHNDITTTLSLEAVIPPAGITSYAMTINSGTYNNTFYFNLGGGAMSNLSASIIYRNQNNSNAYSNSGGNGG